VLLCGSCGALIFFTDGALKSIGYLLMVAYFALLLLERGWRRRVAGRNAKASEEPQRVGL